MSWGEILGHETAIRLLKGQIASGRLPHAILFVGPEGVGKRTLALELARVILCQGEESLRPQASGIRSDSCGDCLPCRQVAEGTFPDLRTVFPESASRWIKIEQVRALEGWMALSPYAGQRKVAILEEADHLTEQATHACLKLLEELGDKGVLLLTATATQRLPQTVVSRCHRVRCAPQGVERVEQALADRQKVPRAQARTLALFSGGRFGLALRIHREDGLARKNAALDQLLDAFRRGQVEVPLSSAPRQELLEALEGWAGWWRDLLVLSLGGNPDWVIHQDRLSELQKIAAGFSPAPHPWPHAPVEALLKRLQHAYRVQDAVRQNVSARVAVGALLSQC